MSECDISFCIPMYNVAPWLTECLDSITAVKGVPYEIICVDDCSTDNTLAVAQAYKEAHPNIAICIEQNEKNSGVSFTRNRMIREAHGKYIAFVDADDLIIPDEYQKMYEIIEKESADKISGDYVYFSDNVPQIAEQSRAEQSRAEQSRAEQSRAEQYAIYSREKTYCPASPCCSLMLKTSIIENNLFFRENMSLNEDVLFNYEFANCANKVIHYLYDVYFYRRHNETSLRFGSRSCERKKSIYFSIKIELRTYHNYYQQGVADQAATKRKLELAKQNAIYYLIRIPDWKFVHGEFRKLHKEGFYPYPFLPCIFTAPEPLWKRICLFLLPIYPFALFLHLFMRKMNR